MGELKQECIGVVSSSNHPPKYNYKYWWVFDDPRVCYFCNKLTHIIRISDHIRDSDLSNKLGTCAECDTGSTIGTWFGSDPKEEANALEQYHTIFRKFYEKYPELALEE